MNNEYTRRVARIFEELAGKIEAPRQDGDLPVVLTTAGSELGTAELVRGAEQAVAEGIRVLLVGPEVVGPQSRSSIPRVFCEDERQAHDIMEHLLGEKRAIAAVTMHYSFPVGVATVGRVLTPARGRPAFIATTTGTASTDRVTALVKNAVYGVAVAKACGVRDPTIGLLNLDGARQAEKVLRGLAHAGYALAFAESKRAGGGVLMRGNDLVAGSADVMVVDSLTGNVLVKVLSAFTSGGDYETTGFGYGPGVGPGFDKIICIVSRASGAPVVANAIKLAGQAAQGNLVGVAATEIESAIRAGFSGFNEARDSCPRTAGEGAVRTLDTAGATRIPRAAKVLTEEIPGIDILELEDACEALTQRGIFARTGMGCVGPVILVSPEDKAPALSALREGGYVQ
ncbi:MAG: glycine/sarcosine/betaine reductase complex component C subunit alpha [Bacillota bacterium]|nr:glycine/sarcosine/betaine reductase complex component C subunit alpha [Bacillota bacterium]